MTHLQKRKTYLLLLMLLALPFMSAHASQIITGLRSDNLVAWSVWEKQGSRLKHYLLVYNTSAQELQVTIKLRRFDPATTHLDEIVTNKTFLRQLLHPQQLVKLSYPRKAANLEFFNFYEGSTDIGLMNINTSQPNASVLQDHYHFYSNQGMNSGEMLYWVALESIYTVPTQIQITAESRFHNEYYLTTHCSTCGENTPWPYKLDSLAKQDASIVKLDSSHTQAMVPVRSNFPVSPLTKLVLLTERVESSYRYDEQKRVVPEIGVTYSSLQFIPIFRRKEQ